MSAGWLINSFRATYNNTTGCNVYSCLFAQTRSYAARKGTREKARKKKVKVVVEKIGFIPHNQRVNKQDAKKVKISPVANIDDSWKTDPIDDVWITKYHKRRVYSLREAIECHRETHHPTMYNEPNSFIHAIIELNLQREKKNKFIDRYSRVIDTPYTFNEKDDRTVLAFCKDPKQLEQAEKAGASFVGGLEIIKQIQAGEFPYKEYEHVVAHPDIYTELMTIRGLLKKRHPSVKTGTLGNDMGALVRKFKHGITYTMIPFTDFKEFGKIDVAFGMLNMDATQLEQNFSAILNDVMSFKPKRDGSFILRVQITSSPSPELFKINYEEYLPGSFKEDVEEDDNTSAVIGSH